MGLAFVSAKPLPLLWDWKDYESTPSHSEFECQGWLTQVTCLPQRYIQTNKCISAPAWVAFAIPDIKSFFILTVLLAPHSCPAAPARLPALGSPTPSLSCSPNSSHCYLFSAYRQRPHSSLKIPNILVQVSLLHGASLWNSCPPDVQPSPLSQIPAGHPDGHTAGL